VTHAPRTPPLAFRDIADVAAALRERGERFSTPRRLVLEALFAADAPVSAEQIARDAGVELTSVYRGLERLEELGVVTHAHIGHGPGLYALTGRAEREYLVCERCKAVTSVEPERLDRVRAMIREDFGHEASFRHFPISGLCAACAGERERERET
jgi:Fur family ferric uptake transcriptional regulator